MPLSAGSSPQRMRKRVDLPEPFGPISPTRSPRSTPRLTPVNRVWAPKALASPWPLSNAHMPLLLPP